MRFGKCGKLSPRYVGLFEVLKRVGEMAYKLALLPNLSAMHFVFHVSLVRMYVADHPHQISYEELEIHPGLLYEKVVVWILNSFSKTFRHPGQGFVV